MSETVQPTDEERFISKLLTDNGYHMAKPIGDGLYACCYRPGFMWSLIVGVIGDTIGYRDRWDYETESGVATALLTWDGTGEPTGWHRHPDSGRRRPGGDPAKEYVQE